MFQIKKITPSDRIYPIKCTYIRIEDILWQNKFYRRPKFGQYDEVKNRAPIYIKGCSTASLETWNIAADFIDWIGMHNI